MPSLQLDYIQHPLIGDRIRPNVKRKEWTGSPLRVLGSASLSVFADILSIKGSYCKPWTPRRAASTEL